jgi:predicted TPR repeat methyltransferase
MSESWDDYADDWDSNSDVIEYSKLAFNSLVKRLELSDKEVLDFGCGTGLLSEQIAKTASKVLAIDSSSKMIEVLENKNISNIQTLTCELSKETIKNNSQFDTKFDLIVASSVCAFLPDLETTLNDLKSLLKEDGLFIQWDWKTTTSAPDFGFDEEKLKTIYKNVGFEIRELNTEFSMNSEKGSMDVIMAIGQKPKTP